jgi:hypothetical protein
MSGPDGIRYVEYNATDNLGNRETPKNYSASGLYLDNGPPVTTVTIGDPNYTSGQDIFVNSSTGFNLSVNEPFATIMYMIDASGPFIYAGDFTIIQEGTHTIYYNATDALGNVESPMNNITVIVDNTPPSTTHTIGTPKYGTDPIYVTSATQFTLSPSDPSGSGVKVTYYRIGGGAYAQYTGPFTLSGYASAPYTIYYYSIDNVGNPEDLRTLSIFLDESPPSANAGIDLYFVQGNTVTLDGSLSTDNSGSISNYTWSFTYDGQPVYLNGVAPNFTFSIVGNYDVSLTVMDPLGNTATDSVWVYITISTDSDDDGLPDAWELIYFDDLTYGPSDDPDNDGWDNSKERDEGTDPSKADTDGDGIDDSTDENPLTPDIREESFLEKYWWALVAIAAVIVVILLLVILLFVRRRKGEEDIDEEEYEEYEEEGIGEEEEEFLEDEEEPEEEGYEEEDEEDSYLDDSEEEESSPEDDELEK